MDYRKRWQFWLGMAVSAFFLYIALKGLHLGEVWRAAKRFNCWWIVPSLLVYFCAMWIRTWRWHYLLLPLKPLPPSRLFSLMTICFMANNIYPARAGEFLRAYALRRKAGVSISSSLATIVIERIFDGVTLLLYLFVSLAFTPLPHWLHRIVLLASLLFFGALAVFFLIAALPASSQAISDRLISRFMPERFRRQVSGLLERFIAGLSCLRSFRQAGMALLTSLLIWLAMIAEDWLIMQGFGFSVNFYALMLMMSVMNLAATIPSSPGYVGTIDAAAIKTLESFGVPGSLAASYTLVLHAVLWLPITLVGLYYMRQESISWQRLAVEAEGGAHGSGEDKESGDSHNRGYRRGSQAGRIGRNPPSHRRNVR